MMRRYIPAWLIAAVVAGCATSPEVEPADATKSVGSASRSADEGELCGGVAGIACDPGLYCNYSPVAKCGAGDKSGVCADEPQACTKEYVPVCGCDDRTYGNACTAQAAGVSIAHEGKCG